MEYPILDELITLNNKRKEDFMKQNDTFFISQIEELTDAFSGSSDNIRLFLFKNYVSNDGLCNLAIIIRDNPIKRNKSDIQINNVETAIFPIFATQEKQIKLNTVIPPDIHPEQEKFIIEKRSLPKKEYNPDIPFDPNKHKWTTMQIAEALHMSNRTVGRFCKAMNI